MNNYAVKRTPYSLTDQNQRAQTLDSVCARFPKDTQGEQKMNYEQVIRITCILPIYKNKVHNNSSTIYQQKIRQVTYSFKHFECLQLHCFCFFGVLSFTSYIGRARDRGDSGLLEKKMDDNDDQ